MKTINLESILREYWTINGFCWVGVDGEGATYTPIKPIKWVKEGTTYFTFSQVNQSIDACVKENRSAVVYSFKVGELEHVELKDGKLILPNKGQDMKTINVEEQLTKMWQQVSSTVTLAISPNGFAYVITHKIENSVVGEVHFRHGGDVIEAKIKTNKGIVDKSFSFGELVEVNLVMGLLDLPTEEDEVNADSLVVMESRKVTVPIPEMFRRHGRVNVDMEKELLQSQINKLKGKEDVMLPTEDKETPPYPQHIRAIVDHSLRHVLNRAAAYDTEDGERSMAKTIAAFNAITGRDLSEAEGWQFMQILKDVRLFTNRKVVHFDSMEDGLCYNALKAESIVKSGL